jgi:hypothetical protein
MFLLDSQLWHRAMQLLLARLHLIGERLVNAPSLNARSTAARYRPND